MSKLQPPVSERDHKTGNQNSGITLVEYGDYQCLHCGYAYHLVKRLLKEHGTEFGFVFRNFPLQEIHPYAFQAAVTAEAAGNQKKYWEMHDLLFENQNQFYKSRLFYILVEQIGINQADFQEDIKSQVIRSKVDADFEGGIRSGVNGTPTFFINGIRIVTYDNTYESLVAAIHLPSNEVIDDPVRLIGELGRTLNT